MARAHAGPADTRPGFSVTRLCSPREAPGINSNAHRAPRGPCPPPIPAQTPSFPSTPDAQNIGGGEPRWGQVESDQLCPAFQNPPCDSPLGTAHLPWAPRESAEVKFAFPQSPQCGPAGGGQGSGPGPRESGVLTPGDARGAREGFPVPCCRRGECGRGARGPASHHTAAPVRADVTVRGVGDGESGRAPPQGTAGAKAWRLARLASPCVRRWSSGLFPAFWPSRVKPLWTFAFRASWGRDMFSRLGADRGAELLGRAMGQVTFYAPW